ncbi:MAG: hypothetical protein PHV17_08445 [Candidatus Omnitrophica bacterium]|nr:hypothetical protein [Candidatus Omnitrophota bacterium]
MRRSLWLVILVLVCFCGASYAKEGSIEILSAPIVLQELGSSAANFRATRFPVFTDMDGEDNCRVFAQSHNQKRYQIGGSSCYDENGNGEVDPKEECMIKSGAIGRLVPYVNNGVVNYKNLIEKEWNLFGANSEVGSAYAKSARIFATFTVRVEGVGVVTEVWHPGYSDLSSTSDDESGTGICLQAGMGYHGTVVEDFPGGDVKTRLVVSGGGTDLYSSEFMMTMPPAAQAQYTRKSDPTITGSMLLSPDDFDGTFPENLTFKLQWVNDSTLDITAPVDDEGNGMYNLVLMITPVN